MLTLEQKINSKRKLIAKHQVELVKLLASCPCSKKKEFSEYTEGGFDYPAAYTRHWKHCELCGKISDDYSIRHEGFR